MSSRSDAPSRSRACRVPSRSTSLLGWTRRRPTSGASPPIRTGDLVSCDPAQRAGLDQFVRRHLACAVEIASGDRPSTQLLRHCAPGVYADLSRRPSWSSRRPAPPGRSAAAAAPSAPSCARLTPAWSAPTPSRRQPTSATERDHARWQPASRSSTVAGSAWPSSGPEQRSAQPPAVAWPEAPPGAPWHSCTSCRIRTGIRRCGRCRRTGRPPPRPRSPRPRRPRWGRSS